MRKLHSLPANFQFGNQQKMHKTSLAEWFFFHRNFHCFCLTWGLKSNFSRIKKLLHLKLDKNLNQNLHKNAVKKIHLALTSFWTHIKMKTYGEQILPTAGKSWKFGSWRMRTVSRLIFMDIEAGMRNLNEFFCFLREKLVEMIF